MHTGKAMSFIKTIRNTEAFLKYTYVLYTYILNSWKIITNKLALQVITWHIPKIEQKCPCRFWINSILCISKFLCFQANICLSVKDLLQNVSQFRVPGHGSDMFYVV